MLLRTARRGCPFLSGIVLADKCLIHGEENLIYLIDVINLIRNEVLDDQVACIRIRKGIARLHQKLIRLIEGELQCYGKASDRDLTRMIRCIASYLGEKLPVDVSLLISFNVRHPLLIYKAKEHLGEALIFMCLNIVFYRGVSRCICALNSMRSNMAVDKCCFEQLEEDARS